jgi:hypothetical protein
MSVLAHQGEELLIPAVVVALVLGIPAIRSRLQRRREGGPPTASECAYCGSRLPARVEWCQTCGFRVRR